MDIFDTLEERIARLIAAYAAAQQRVVELETENARLAGGGDAAAGLHARIAALEEERAQLRRRLERLLENLASLEL